MSQVLRGSLARSTTGISGGLLGLMLTFCAGIFRDFSLGANIALPQTPTKPASAIEFVDTSFENASPLWYEFDDAGVVQLQLLYDHERNSPNRAAGHVHFKLVGTPGANVDLEINNSNERLERHQSLSRSRNEIARRVTRRQRVEFAGHERI